MPMAADSHDAPKVAVHLLRGRAARSSQAMLGSAMLLGADAQCDVQLRSPDVAPKHCLLSRRDGRVLATRLDAGHPVLRNGSLIAEEELSDGDELAIGPFSLRVSIGAAAAAGAATPPTVRSAPLPTRPSFPLLRRRAEAAAAPSEPVVRPDPAPVRADDTQRRSAELDARDAELKAWEARLGAEGADLDRRRETLARDHAALAAEQAAAQARGERLEALKRKELDRARRRRGRLAGLLADLERRQNAAAAPPPVEAHAAEFARLQLEHQEAAAELDRRAAELAFQDARLAEERELLAAEWRKVEAARAELETLRAELDRRAADLVRDEETLRSVRAETVRDRERLVVELDALDRRSEAVAADETRVRERGAELAADAERLRAMALALRAEIERERQALERERAAVAAEAAAQEEAQLVFAGEREAWHGRRAALEQERGELARHASLLAARERSLAAANAPERRAELQREQDALARRARDAEARFAAAEAESQRLAAVAADLEARQHALLERERRLAAETGRRGADFQQREAALAEARRQLAAGLERQAAGATRLRRVGLRLAARRREDARRDTAFAQRLAECEAELKELRASHGQLAATLRDYQQWIAERERTAAAWLQELRTQSQALFAAHGQLARHAGRDRVWRERMQDWSARLEQLHRSLGEGEQALGLPAGAGGDADLPTFEQAWTDALAEAEAEAEHDEAPATLPFPGLAVRQAAPEPAAPTIPAAAPRGPALRAVSVGEPAALPAAFGSAPLAAEHDISWVFGLAEAGVADEAVLKWMVDHTQRNRLPLAATLVDEGIATPHQVELARAGRQRELAIGPWRALEVLHAGRIASTYRVMAPAEGRAYAFRWFRAGLIANPSRQSDLHAHVRALAGFRHPCFATPLGCHVIDGRPGVLSEVLRGEPLPTVAAGLPPLQQAVAYRQVAAALAALQENGFAHRSLRPSRVLLDRQGRVGIVGLGEPTWLSRLHLCELGGAADYYLAPEQLDPDRPVDARADLCAAGRIFLELALGRRPRDGEAVRLPAGFPAGYTALLARCVDPDPAQRPASLAGVAAELDRMFDRLRPAEARAA